MNTEQTKDWVKELASSLLWIGSQWAMTPINTASSLALKQRAIELIRAAFEKQTAELKQQIEHVLSAKAADDKLWRESFADMQQRAEAAETRVKELERIYNYCSNDRDKLLNDAIAVEKQNAALVKGNELYREQLAQAQKHSERLLYALGKAETLLVRVLNEDDILIAQDALVAIREVKEAK